MHIKLELKKNCHCYFLCYCNMFVFLCCCCCMCLFEFCLFCKQRKALIRIRIFCCCFVLFVCLFVCVFFAKTHLTYLTYDVISPDHMNRRSLILAKMCLGMVNEHLQKSKLSAWLKIASEKSVAST